MTFTVSVTSTASHGESGSPTQEIPYRWNSPVFRKGSCPQSVRVAESGHDESVLEQVTARSSQCLSEISPKQTSRGNLPMIETPLSLFLFRLMGFHCG